MVEMLTEDSFQAAIEGSDVPVLVDCFATWCGPCKMMAPVFDELSETYKNVKFISCDVDECPESAQAYGIMSIPSMIMFKDGKPSDPVIGAQPKKNLEDFIEKFA